MLPRAILLGGIFLSALCSFASVVYVDVDATGTNNGTSWANAYTDLQDAMATAVSGDEIWVAEGVYKPTTGLDPVTWFDLPPGVDMYGGFDGTETLKSQRDWALHTSILSGDIGVEGNIYDNCRQLLHVIDSPSSIVDGFVFRDTYSDTFGTSSGAVKAYNSTLYLRRCAIIDNYGYYAPIGNFTMGTFEFTSCLFARNHGTSDGTMGQNACMTFGHAGQIITMQGCTFTDNTHADPNTREIAFGQGCEGVMENCIVWNNEAQGIPELHEDMVYTNNILQGAPVLENGNLITDPLFSDPANRDYSLQPHSPAINVGGFGDFDQYDLARKSRKWDGLTDMGCYEFQTEGIIYVDDDATGEDTGASWADAFNRIQFALSAWQPGQVIFVAEGTYFPSYIDDRYESLVLEGGMQIYGGFEAGELLFENRDPEAFPTIISGDIGVEEDASDNTLRILVAEQVVDDVLLNGLIIEASNRELGLVGGGVCVEGPSDHTVEVNQCLFREHYSGLGACLGSTDEGEVRLVRSTFEGLSDVGNGVYIVGCDLPVEISECSFQNHQTSALYVQDSELMLSDSRFVNNVETSGPPAFLAINTSVIAKDCLFRENQSSSGNGVMTVSDPGNAWFDRCEFIENSSEYGTGVTAYYNSDLGDPLVFSNCLFDGNSGEHWACFFSGSGRFEFYSNTFVKNTNTDVLPNSACIFLQFDFVQLHNNLFWGNTTDWDIGGLNMAYPISGNLMNTPAGTGEIVYAPQFIDFDGGNYHTTSHSPVFEFGNADEQMGNKDLDGNPRLLGTGLDVGCYEVTECLPPNDVCSGALWVAMADTTFMGSNRCALTNDTYANCFDSGTLGVWYRFEAPLTGHVQIDLTVIEGWGSTFEASMALFEGNCASLTELSCVNAAGPDQALSLVQQDLTPGANYLFQVVGNADEIGRYALTLTELPPPPPPSVCAEDLNSDGEVTTSDILALLGEFGCTTACTADLNNDGETGTSDLLVVLGVFGVVCY